MVDKDIPIPDKVFSSCRKLERRSKYSWRKCTEVGDSFIAREKNPARVYEAARKFCSRNKEYKFHVQQQDDGTVRVWRVK